MNLTKRCMVAALCLLLGSTSSPAIGRDDVLSAIPADVLGFAVVHNLSAASQDVGDLAKLVQAPTPDLLALAKGMTGLSKGIDEEGDLAVVVTGSGTALKQFILAPVSSFDEFFASLKVEHPGQGIEEATVAGRPMLIGRKGTFAILAPADNREGLEKLLAATDNLASDKTLSEWLHGNRVNVVLTPLGMKQALPKVIEGIRATQAQMQQLGGENGKTAAAGMNVYLELFAAAEKEIEQCSVAFRIDANHTVDVVARAKLKSDGSWAKWATKAKPADEDLLGGLEAKPLIMAMGAAVPRQAADAMKKVFVQFVKKSPVYAGLTPEMAEKYSELSMRSLSGINSMRMLMGTPQGEGNIYSNASYLVTMDDSKAHLEQYEKMAAEIQKLAAEAKNSSIPTTTTNRIKIGDIDALEVSMKIPPIKQVGPPGGPDPQKIMKLFLGEDGVMKVYMAAADEHTVITAYFSPDRLKEAIDFYKSKQPGLSNDPNVVQVVDKMPAGSQVVVLMSLSGIVQMGKQAAMLMGGPGAAFMPEIADSPPLGFGGKLSAAGVEAHVVITADTLRSIGDGITNMRAKIRQRQLIPQR